MRITDLLDKRSISLDAAPKSKEEALNDAVALMEAAGRLNDVEGYRRQVFARVHTGSLPAACTPFSAMWQNTIFHTTVHLS